MPANPNATKQQAGTLQASKHSQLARAQTTTFVAAAIAIFVVVFTLVAAKSLMSQQGFHSRVIDAKKAALSQLETNQTNVTQLDDQYKDFITDSQNMLGGSPTGTGPRDGNNAVLVLQALPKQYDYPALLSSIEKLISSQNMSIKSIDGSDEEVTQQGNSSDPNPQPIEMPFSASAEGGYGQVKSLVGQFERSIRPFQIQQLELKGDQDDMTVSITAQTYWQPGKNFQIRHKVVK